MSNEDKKDRGGQTEEEEKMADKSDEANTERWSGQQNSKDVTLTQTRQSLPKLSGPGIKKNSDGHQADGGEQKGRNDEMNVWLFFLFCFNWETSK